ncbi:TetR/AcrR family transcriptional regulator [Aquihabitans sp. G128]|uniref:TetR/AcrR family transcriptional regulator n=1 Tax=Aquihabitans sp. G128 TaxID=2849779 RepID=UPI001C22E26B|nr:TetR/AcrR family transcriptional regulator [Aquihabitans sp. G128]QXC63098.1 TetR/AcrR family transcriptional regulator [Aquihabitans sp. G128]
MQTAEGAGDGGASGDDAAPRRPGRPRDARADEAIVNAVLELLVEVGFGGLTVDAVAHRAGVGKATIYRRWNGKEQLVLDALSTERQNLAVPDTGSVRQDLWAMYEPMTGPVAQQATVRLLPALAAEAAVNPDLAEQLQAFVSDSRARARTVLRRGQERGEVRADADLELCIDLLTGSLIYRMVFRGAAVDAATVRAAIDLVLGSVGPASA